MADEKEKLATEKETKQVAQERLSVNRENKAVDEETLEIQRRIRDSQFGIVAELKEQFGIKSKISLQDQTTLSLSRTVTRELSESNRELRRTGKLESQILKEKRLIAQTQQQINDSLYVLSAEGAKQLKTALAIAKTTKLQTEDYARYLETVKNEGDKALINQIVLGKTQADNIVDTIALREKEIGVQSEVNQALGIAGALTDNLQRIGLRAFGGLGINLGVFKEGLADAKEQSTALAESFVGIDRIFAGLETKDLMEEAKQDPNLVPRILAASEAYIHANDKGGVYKKLVEEIAQLESNREGNVARLEQLKLLEKEREARIEVLFELQQQGRLTDELKDEQLELYNQTLRENEERDKIKKTLDETSTSLEGLTNTQLEMAVAAATTAESTGLMGRQLATLKKLGPGIGKALKQGLVDPFVLGVFSVEGIMKAFGELDKAQTDLQRSTGQTVSQFAQLELSYVTQVDILKVANALTQELGRNAMNIFPDKILHDVADFEKRLGMSAKEAGMLGVSAQITGRSMDDIGGSIVDTVSSFNKANRSAINQGQILKDVANASAGVSVSLGKNPEALAKAASEARRLGLELDKLDQIASSLLDFESSIENELSAQLLTGRDINMNKARELALTNDLEGLGKEIFNNSVDIYEFGKMNKIQQEAMGKALGMNRDELARMAYLRALETGMTDKQAAAAANVGLEDMKRLEVQESLKASIEKIAQALAGPVAAFASIFQSIGGIVPALLMAVAATKTFAAGAKAVAFWTAATASAEGQGLRTKLKTLSTIILTGKSKAILAAMDEKAKADALIQLGLTGKQAAATTTQVGAEGAANAAKSIGLATTIATTAAKVRESVATAATTAGQFLLNKAKGVGLFSSIATAISTGFTAAMSSPKSLLTGGIAGLILGAIITGAILSSVGKAKQIKDGTVNPNGGLVISSPEGSTQPIQTAKGDYVMASTNEPMMGQQTINPQASSTSNAQNERLMSKIEELISSMKQGGDVYLDGDKVGTALTKGTYRNS